MGPQYNVLPPPDVFAYSLLELERITSGLFACLLMIARCIGYHESRVSGFVRVLRKQKILCTHSLYPETNPTDG